MVAIKTIKRVIINAISFPAHITAYCLFAHGNSFMDKHTYHAGGAPEHSARPSLYSAHSESRKNTEDFSVLGGLEPRRSVLGVFRRKAWSASILSLAAVVLVVGMNGGFENSGVTTAAAEAAGEARETVAIPAQPEAPSQEAVAAPLVATIVSEPVSGEAESNAEAAVPSTAVAAATDMPNTVVASAPPYASMLTPVADAADAGAVQKPDPASAKAGAVAKKTGTKAAPAESTTARASAGNGARDKDVDLIAALLAHVSPAPAVQGKNVKKNPETVPTAAAAASVSTAPRRERSRTSNRDIVTRDSTESLESLVNRCRSLGFFEGELCRLRICSGMWGKDPACPSGTPSSSG